MEDVLPGFLIDGLRQGFESFGKKMRGYLTNDAQIVGVESRTSSPVRIPRNKESLEHVATKRLFPCAEGAGYAVELYQRQWMESDVPKRYTINIFQFE